VIYVSGEIHFQRNDLCLWGEVHNSPQPRAYLLHVNLNFCVHHHHVFPQVSSLKSYLSSTCPSSFSGTIWLDIEGSQYWLGSYSANQVRPTERHTRSHTQTRDEESPIGTEKFHHPKQRSIPPLLFH
jgi:hypothetical protein